MVQSTRDVLEEALEDVSEATQRASVATYAFAAHAVTRLKHAISFRGAAPDGGRERSGTLDDVLAESQTAHERARLEALPKLSSVQRAYAVEMFARIDVDGSGQLTRDELARYLHFFIAPEQWGFVAERIDAFFASSDLDGDGGISEVEFVHFIETHAAHDAEEAGTITTVGNHAVVEQFYRQLPAVQGERQPPSAAEGTGGAGGDDGGDGEHGFTRDGFRAALEHINGAKLIRWHTDELFTIADENGDGVVTAREFADLTAGTLDAKISEHLGQTDRARECRDILHRALAVVSMAAMIQTEHGRAPDAVRRELRRRRSRSTRRLAELGAAGRPEKPQSLAANLKRRDLLQSIFAFFDTGGEGSISDEEMVAFLSHIGLGENEDDIKRALDALDADNSGEVSFDEFIEYVDKMQAETSQDVSTEQVYRKMFALVDRDQQGGISAKEFTETLNALGQEMRLTDVMELTADVDNDGSGEIEFGEFEQLMRDLDIP